MNEISRYTAVVAQHLGTIQTGNNIVTNTMQTLYFFGRGNSPKCLKCEAKQAKSCLQLGSTCPVPSPNKAAFTRQTKVGKLVLANSS